MLDGNELKFGDLLVEKGNECNSLFIFLTYIASRSNIKLLKIPCDVYIPSVPVWKPDYESFLDSRYVRDRGFYRPILNMNYADPDVIKVHNDKANPYLNLGEWLYNCSLYPIKIVGGRHCGKTLLAKELARQLLNSTYGLASADNWAQRYLYTVDKLYDTLGIKDYLNKVYGDPMTAKRSVSLKETAKKYGCDLDFTINWDIGNIIKDIEREEEKSMTENRIKLGEWTFRGDISLDGRKSDFNAEIPTTVYASKSGLRFAFHPDENSSHIVDVVVNDCDFNFFVKVHTDTRHKLTIHDTYPNNLVLKKIREAYNAWFLTNLYQPRERNDEVRYTAPHYAMPKIEKVIFNPPATIVKWKDGTKTIVKCQDGDEFDWEKGLAMAYVKRAFNNERTYYGLFKKNEPFMNLPNTKREFQALYDPMVEKEVQIIVPKDFDITRDILLKAHDLIAAEGTESKESESVSDKEEK